MRRLGIRPGGIGDFIVSLPALERLKPDYLEVWAASPNVPLARFADRARSIGSTGLDLLGIAEPPKRLIDDLRGFDSIVSWYGANRPEFRESVRALGLPFEFFPALPPEGSEVHATDFYLRQAGAIVGAEECGPTRSPVAWTPYVSRTPESGHPKEPWTRRRRRRHIDWRWCVVTGDRLSYSHSNRNPRRRV